MARMTEAMARLSARLSSTAVAGEAVAYTRGRTTIAVTAIPGMKRSRRDALGQTERVQQDSDPMDFLIDPAVLVFNGEQVEPEAGHRIGYAGETFEVMPRDGEPCWRPCDPAGTLIRVHTIRVS